MCGIAGFIGSHKKENFKMFNPLMLHLLMIAQDSRGRDNCGMYYRCYDEEKNVREIVQWGGASDEVGSTKTFELFLGKRKDSMLPYAPPYKVIAHSRKASSGSESMDNAHPFKHGNIIGVHNGTIDNWKKLMEYLEVDTQGIDVDSSAIFKAFSEGKTKEFLAAYTGGAALVWTDISLPEDTVFVWVGESPSTTFYGGKATLEVERPLHGWQTKAGVYLSSEKLPLEKMALAAPKGYSSQTPKIFESNAITTFVNGQLKSIEKIERVPATFTTKTESSMFGPTVSTQTTKEIIENVTKNPGKEIGTTKNDSPAMFDKGFEERSMLRSYFRLEIYYGRYYRSGQLLHSFVSNSGAFLTREIEELRSLGYYIKTRWYISTINDLLYYKGHEGNFYSCTAPATMVPAGSDHIKEVYFYQGVLIRSEADLLALQMIEASGNKVRALDVASRALCPVREDLMGESLAAKLVKFYMPGSLHVGGKPLYMQANYVWPYTETMYYFEMGSPTKVDTWGDNCMMAQSSADGFYTSLSHKGPKIAHAIEDPKRDNLNSLHCPSCKSLHYFSNEELMRLPYCTQCDTPIVPDEDLFKILQHDKSES